MIIKKEYYEEGGWGRFRGIDDEKRGLRDKIWRSCSSNMRSRGDTG